ncbi:MAG TPA: hypothetical protein PLM70_05855 [Bacteroidales bacterium]|nr:hypothetical protein [Bacteroidales bacterium]
MRKSIFLFVFLTVSLISFGQQTNNNVIKGFRINEYSIQTGLFGGSSSSSSLSDFNILAPNSVLLNSNIIPDLQSYSPYSYHSGPNSSFSALLGFQFSDKQKTKYNKYMQLRVGITYTHNSIISGGMYNTERIRFDTLTSSQTGNTTYLDSVVTKSLDMNYSSEQLRLDGALIFRTNPDARWSLYSGIGITAGFSFNSKTTIVYGTNYRIENQDSDDNMTYMNCFDGDSKIELFTNKNNFGFSAYIPLGINLKLGKNTEFWKKVNLFYEIRPSIGVTSIPELRTVVNTSVQQGIGFKISL